MYMNGKMTSEFSSLVPAVVHPCCQRQGCSLIEWKASGFACASSHLWKPESDKHDASIALTFTAPQVQQEECYVPGGVMLPAWPTETAGPDICHYVIKKEEQQLFYIAGTEINHSWKERKINESLNKPTCKHY